MCVCSVSHTSHLQPQGTISCTIVANSHSMSTVIAVWIHQSNLFTPTSGTHQQMEYKFERLPTLFVTGLGQARVKPQRAHRSSQIHFNLALIAHTHTSIEGNTFCSCSLVGTTVVFFAGLYWLESFRSNFLEFQMWHTPTLCEDSLWAGKHINIDGPLKAQPM